MMALHDSTSINFDCDDADNDCSVFVSRVLAPVKRRLKVIPSDPDMEEKLKSYILSPDKNDESISEKFSCSSEEFQSPQNSDTTSEEKNQLMKSVQCLDKIHLNTGRSFSCSFRWSVSASD